MNELKEEDLVAKLDLQRRAMDFPSIMVSRSEKRSRGRADRIGSSRWMVVEDPAPAMAKQGLS